MDESKIDVDYEALDRLLEALGEGVGSRVSVSVPARAVAPPRHTSRGWPRRVRGSIGVGLTWAAAWGLVGGLIWFIRTAADYGLDSFSIALFLGRQYAIVGFLGGVTFSALLNLTNGRRRFDELRTSRFTAWGAVGGLLIGGGYSAALTALFGGGFEVVDAQFVAVTTLCGAGSAAGSLAMARRAQDRHLLDPVVTTKDAGLSPDETREPRGKAKETSD